MGTNTIQVMSGNFTQGGVRQGQGNASTLTPEDAAAIRDVPGVLYAAASQNTRGQMIALHDDRTRDLAVSPALEFRPDVDQDRPVPDRIPGLLRLEPREPRARG